MTPSTQHDRVQAAIALATRSQPVINAFTSIDQEAGVSGTGPLAGVPIGLKDLIDHAGRTTTCGSAFYRHEATTTAPCVARLEAAGGVIVGRTGLHEWAFGFSSENPHWGPVRNPWDTNTSAGGSSGGSGAAVAAGITPIAIGTDTGGSVRVPAALCGTFGLKVTHERVPLEGVFPLVASIDTVGPLADSMENIDLAYRAIAVDDELIPQPAPMRLGVPQPWYEDSPTSEDIALEFEKVVDSLRSLGHEVHPISMPDVAPAVDLWNAIAEEVRTVHRPFRDRNEPYGADVARRLQDADKVTEDEARVAHGWQEMIRTRFNDAFHAVDYLITPTVPVRQKIIGEDSIGHRHYRAVVSYFTAVVNHSLHPALAVPIADSGNPPASLQIIGSMGDESGLIGFGKVLEKAGIAAFRRAPIEFT